MHARTASCQRVLTGSVEYGWGHPYASAHLISACNHLAAGASAPLFGIAALQSQAAQMTTVTPAASGQKRSARDEDTAGRGGKRARAGAQQQEPNQDTSFSFPILASRADENSPPMPFRMPPPGSKAPS